FRFELDCFLESVPGFRQQVEVKTHQPKIIVNAGVLRCKLSRMGEVAQGSLVIVLLVRNARHFQQQPWRSLVAGRYFLERSACFIQSVSARISRAKSVKEL